MSFSAEIEAILIKDGRDWLQDERDKIYNLFKHDESVRQQLKDRREELRA